MDTFGLKIIASDRVFYEGRCRKLVIPAPDGEKGILPNHENMVIAVKIGMARMEIEEGNWVEVALGRGFAEVVNNRVTLLVDTAEKPEEIDIRHAQEQKERADEAAPAVQPGPQTQGARAHQKLTVALRVKVRGAPRTR